MQVSRIGIVGAGQMGRGIAQIAAAAGYDVVLYDALEQATEDAIRAVNARYSRMTQKGRMAAADAAAAAARLHPAVAMEELRSCDLVIEAVVEDVAVKRSVFEQLAKVARPEAVLATNTLSFSVTELSNAVTAPDRFVGLHFFNPVPLMKLVEVIPGLRTGEHAVAAVRAAVERMGHKAVVVSDTPGFLVNHAGRAYVTEAFRLLEERIADPETIDIVMRDGGGFRMGPFELMDLTGLDITHPATEAIYNGFYQEPRLRPSHIARQRLAGGRLGRKTKSGFYGGQMTSPTVERPCAGTWSRPVALVIDEPAAERMIRDALGIADISILPDVESDEAELLIAVSAVHDATTVALRSGLDPKRVAVFDAAGLDRSVWTLSGTIATPSDRLHGLAAALSEKGRQVLVSGESPGHIFLRIVATVVNLACDMAAKGIAAPVDIDRAIRIALGYPDGPLEWGDRIGARTILEVLEELQHRYGDPRYRPSLWLRRRVELQMPLTHEEVLSDNRGRNGWTNKGQGTARPSRTET